MRAIREIQSAPACPTACRCASSRRDCVESAGTPRELFAKLDDWGHASLVIPHGTTWGMYTPPGSSWAKQLGAQHDPQRQTLVEVYSGHGNTEEFRPWVAAVDIPTRVGSCRRCPGAERADYTPACFRRAARSSASAVRPRARARRSARRERARRASTSSTPTATPVRGPCPGLQPYELGDAGQCTHLLPAGLQLSTARERAVDARALEGALRPGSPLWPR